METAVSPDTPIARLQKLQETGRTLPGEIRSLDWEVVSDRTIAEALDQDASDSVEGAIDPEKPDSRLTMTSEALERWVKGDENHDLKVFSLKKRVYGFGYAYNDGKEGDPRYDQGFNRRVAFLREHADVHENDIREYNFWTDRSDSHFPEDNTELRHKTTVSWVAKHLLSLFEQHAEKQGDVKSLALFTAVQPEDLPIDGKVLQELGFYATEKTTGRDYDDPQRDGDNTLFFLTFDAFAKALIARDKKSQVSP